MKRGCLLIHGFGGNVNDILPLQQYLKKNTTLYIETITLSGHGKELNLKKATRREWINDCLTSYDSLRKKCCVVDVIGFSMGSLLALQVAAYRNVHRLVLIAPAVQMVSKSQLFILGKRLFKRLMTSFNQSILSYNIMKNRFPNIHLRGYLELRLLQNETKQFLTQIDMPVLIALGKLDEFISYKKTADWFEVIDEKHKQFVLFGESGHFLCWDQNNHTLKELIMEFIQKKVTH